MVAVGVAVLVGVWVGVGVAVLVGVAVCVGVGEGPIVGVGVKVGGTLGSRREAMTLLITSSTGCCKRAAMAHEDLKFREPLVYRPKTLATVKFMLQIASLHLQIDYRYASEIEAVKIYPINDRVAMKFIDIRSSYDYKNLTFQIGVNNLLNYNYTPMESNLLPMRTYTVGLKGEL